MNDLLLLGEHLLEPLAHPANQTANLATLTLAQDGLPNPGAPAQPNQPPPGGGGFSNMFLPLMMVMLTVMILMSVLSGRGEKKRRKSMLESLSKRDRVQTTAGIIGTVVEMKGDEIVLKVDETSNTRIRFAKSSVQQVLRSSGGGGGSSSDAEASPASSSSSSNQADASSSSPSSWSEASSS